MRNSNVANSIETASFLVGLNIGGLAWIGTACHRSTNYYRTGVMGLAKYVFPPFSQCMFVICLH